jgi:hypothetical protein
MDIKISKVDNPFFRIIIFLKIGKDYNIDNKNKRKLKLVIFIFMTHFMIFSSNVFVTLKTMNFEDIF